MTRKLRAKIGVIGLGIIGSRVAANLRTAGHQVYVWNRSPRAEPNFLGSSTEVAQLCDFIQLFVSDDASLLEVVKAIAPTLTARHIVTAHPTVSPQTMRDAAELVQARGARFLDAPFTGSKTAAENAQLIFYVSGSGDLVEEVRPYLEATAKKIVYCGSEIGQASVVKIATNMVTAATVEILAEALAVVQSEGVRVEHFQEAMENNGSYSKTIGLKLPLMRTGNYEPHFSLKHMLKDVKHALEIGLRNRITLPVAATTTSLLFGCEKRGWGDLDFSVLFRNYDSTLQEKKSKEAAVLEKQNEVTTKSETTSPKAKQTKTARFLRSIFGVGQRNE